MDWLSVFFSQVRELYAAFVCGEESGDGQFFWDRAFAPRVRQRVTPQFAWLFDPDRRSWARSLAWLVAWFIGFCWGACGCFH